LATGLVVAAYAAGAAAVAPVFAGLVRAGGTATALAFTAGFMMAIGLAAAALFHRSGVRFEAGHGAPAGAVAGDAVFVWLWLGFLAGSATGVMALGHAATIAAAYGAGPEALVVATVLVALGNGAGRLAGGWLGDRAAPRRALAATQLLLALALVPPLLAPSVPAVLATLLLAGIAYGATASLYPLAVSHYYGADRLGQVYGRLFTAWGVAGLAAPWLAGALFDWTGGYAAGLGLGIAAAAFATVTSLHLPGAVPR
jgi:MFS family permease